MGVPMAANLVRARLPGDGLRHRGRARAEICEEHQCARGRFARRSRPGLRLVITMLPTGREVRQALLEARRRARARICRAGSLVIDMSSSDPVGTRALGAELAAHKIELVDAPVVGRRAARQGRHARHHDRRRRRCRARGEAGAVERMGGKLFEVGGLGCGHAMKALNNFLAGTSFAAAREAVRVGRTFGLDPAVMIDVINVSTGRSFPTDLVMKQHVLSGNFAHRLCARPSGQGRQDRRRSRVAGRRRCADRAG